MTKKSKYKEILSELITDLYSDFHRIAVLLKKNLSPEVGLKVVNQGVWRARRLSNLCQPQLPCTVIINGKCTRSNI